MANAVPIGPRGQERPRDRALPRPLLRKVVGNVLRRHRLHQRRTLADVAGSARVSTQYLSEVERGRKEASSEVLAAVCRALRIELTDLLADAGRDLAADRAASSHAPVLRLGLVGEPPAGQLRPTALPRPAHRPGDAMLLAA